MITEEDLKTGTINTTSYENITPVTEQDYAVPKTIRSRNMNSQVVNTKESKATTKLKTNSSMSFEDVLEEQEMR